jgi:hypothetical protein
MRAYAILVVSTGMLSSFAQTNCTTPLGLQCVVVQSVNEQWSVLNHGINYSHWKTYEQMAWASDGSIAYQDKGEKIPLTGDPEVFAPTAYLYLRPSDRVVRILYGDHTFSRREPIIWHDRPYRRAKPNDTTCASGILHSGTDFHVVGDDTILGLKTIRWYRPLENGGYEEQFLAPALDCLSLRTRRVYKNFLRFPELTDRTEVTSIHFGEPDRSLFQIPADYKEVPDPSADRLRRFVEANRLRISTRAR